MDDKKNLRDIGLRLQGLREACDYSIEDMARELEVSYHMARLFGVEFTEILTGTAAKLDTYHVVRRGEGQEIDRFPGYHYDDMAWRFRDKIMQPLMVVLDPSDEPAALVTHRGQEFNFVVEGSITVVFDDKEIVLNEWDSIYFNPMHPHGQRCHGDKTAKFITIIAE